MEDESGELLTAIPLCEVDYNGEKYVVLNIVHPDNDTEDADTIIMRESKDSDGNACYESEWDEKIMKAVFELFLKKSDQ